MKHLYAAADLIESANLGEIGVNIFVNAMPADVHKGVMLRDPLYGAELDEQEGFTKHQFQVIVRDSYPADAWNLAYQIGEVLRVTNYTGQSAIIREMYPLERPVTYPKMDSDEMETSIRIRCWFSIA